MKASRFTTLLKLEKQYQQAMEDKKQYTDNSIRALKAKIDIYKKLCYKSKYYNTVK